ncbi:DUF3576 domain-containing protein [Parvibaculum sp.]|uniref:DUF3576 domain-containing protein n=1 Tax=Parvibaculum sp. TaxID=2024848 RepID=UPI0025D93787|nr:DUF3576 domain-containing protein [Parvibaculum sp.]
MTKTVERRSLRAISATGGKLSHVIRFALAAAILMTASVSLTACGVFSGGERQYPDTTGRTGPTTPAPKEGDRQTVFGEGGLNLFGGGGSGDNTGGGIGVNSYLWRASLDTLSFMPLASADPFGGVIITDWYQDPKAQGERFKVTTYILDKRLRADGVKVAVFRQKKDDKDNWVDTPVDQVTATKIENAILVRARELRMRSVDNTGN